MYVSRSKKVVCVLALALAFAAFAQASMVQKMDLGEVCARADKIFRGTVVSVTDGSVAVGGGELPTITYRIKVDEAFQGDFVKKGDAQYAEVTMLGDFKNVTANGLERRSPLTGLPRLSVGGDYLLMTSRPSEIGLSAPIGLGQGCYSISGKGDNVVATNEVGESFKYAEMANMIRAALTQ